VVLQIAFVLASVVCQDDKAAEAEAKKRVEDFKAKIKTCKSGDDYVLALEGLGDQPHAVILAELKKWVARVGQPDLQIAAGKEVAKFKKDVKAAQFLIQMARAEKTGDVAASLYKSAGATGARGAAKDLNPTLVYKDIKPELIPAAKGAVEATGLFKSRDSIDPLIALLTELEKEKAEADKAAQQPVVSGVPQDDKNKPQRHKELLDPAIKAIKAVTGEKFMTAKEYTKWWSKNKQFFKEPPEE
jgi:hypothetical protein